MSNKTVLNVDVHADDYAYSVNTSKDILDCIKEGKLDSFSIICNTSQYESCMKLLYDTIPNLPILPLMSVHINLVEGLKTSPEDLDLISDNGILNKSWGYYFSNSYKPSGELKNQLKKEIKAQIDKTWEDIMKCFEIADKNGVEREQNAIRIDSHVHTHLIHVVWNALIEVIEENDYKIEYIRNPKEPAELYFDNRILKTIEPINIIKNRILMLYSKKVDDYCDKNGINKMYMIGLMMSGKMDLDRINVIYDKTLEKARKDSRTVEFLFHPGKALESEKEKEMNDDYFSSFNSSDNRLIEKEAVLKLRRD